MVKNPPDNIGDSDSIPGVGRSPGEGNGKPLQYSCWENPMDGGGESDTTEHLNRHAPSQLLVTLQISSAFSSTSSVLPSSNCTVSNPSL